MCIGTILFTLIQGCAETLEKGHMDFHVKWCPCGENSMSDLTEKNGCVISKGHLEQRA